MRDQIATLLPPAVTDDPQLTASELPRAVLMRVNFIPGVRQQLGWRGVKECSENVGALTVKINSAPGVFAIYPEGAQASNNQGMATFRLYYFPAPEEELLESFSVAAGIEVLSDGFIDRVREFASHNKLLTLFNVATLKVFYNKGNGAIGITLIAPQRQLLVSAQGIYITGPCGEQQAVAAGGIDQDLPAFNVIYPYFQALAASFSFCLASAPNALQQCSRTGRSFTYYPDNRFEERNLDDSKELSLTLIWGKKHSFVDCKMGFSRVEINWEDPAEKPSEYFDSPWWQTQISGARFSLDKNSMGISEKPKLIVLTGFLGAGKTSFLNHFIEYQASKNAFVAIVQNEIGKQGLDAKLLGQHYAVTEMDEGCVCCTLSGNLKLALRDILNSFQPDFVVVETTGLANPANFISEISEVEDLLAFCSITTLVDASQGGIPLERYGVAREQLILADVIIINKIDQASADQVAKLTAEIQSLNQFAAIHEARYGGCSPAKLYGVNFQGHRPFQINEKVKTAGPKHADDGISSLMQRLSQPLNRERFLAATASFPEQVLRVKGVLMFQDEESPFAYQYVPGSQAYEPLPINDFEDSFLVFIGEDIQNAIKPFFKILTD